MLSRTSIDSVTILPPSGTGIGPATVMRALDIYRKLEPQVGKLNVDIKVILLTSSSPGKGFSRESGTEFRDTVVPIYTMLKVRDLTASQSVARVSSYFNDRDKRNGVDTNASPSNSTLRTVELEADSFSLPLGWKLSKATFGVISSLIGRAEICDETSIKTEKDATATMLESKAEITIDKEPTLHKNGCVLRDVEKALAKWRSARAGVAGSAVGAPQ